MLKVRYKAHHLPYPTNKLLADSLRVQVHELTGSNPDESPQN